MSACLVEARVNGTGPFAAFGPYDAQQNRAATDVPIQVAAAVALDDGTRTDAMVPLDSAPPDAGPTAGVDDETEPAERATAGEQSKGPVQSDADDASRATSEARYNREQQSAAPPTAKQKTNIDAGSHGPGMFDAGDARPVQYVQAKSADAIGPQRETNDPPTLVWSQRLLKSPEPTLDGAFGFTIRVANILNSKTLNRLEAGAQSITATKVVSFGLLLDAQGVPQAKISTEVAWRLDINNIGNRKLPVQLDDTVALRGRKRYAALVQIAYKVHGVRRSTADPLKVGKNMNVSGKEYTAAIESMAASRMDAIIKYVYLDKERLDKADEATRTAMETSIGKILPKLGELPNKLEALEYRGLGAWWFKDGRKGSTK